MTLTAKSLLFFFLFSSALSLAQKKCCTCMGDGQKFQIPQSTGCDIGCAAARGTSVGLEACFSDPYPHSYPVPQDQCGAYWSEIGGSCKGNHWCQCSLEIQLVTVPPKAGQAIQVRFKNDNLGQILGTRRHAISSSGSIDWGDGGPTQVLTTGTHILSHTYEKAGEYKISAELHGDFKWNNPDEGASCSYRCKTAPAAININVLPKPVGPDAH
jgi:hypothetical protein